jgi:hypothetical protein
MLSHQRCAGSVRCRTRVRSNSLQPRPSRNRCHAQTARGNADEESKVWKPQARPGLAGRAGGLTTPVSRLVIPVTGPGTQLLAVCDLWAKNAERFVRLMWLACRWGFQGNGSSWDTVAAFCSTSPSESLVAEHLLCPDATGVPAASELSGMGGRFVSKCFLES